FATEVVLIDGEVETNTSASRSPPPAGVAARALRQPRSVLALKEVLGRDDEVDEVQRGHFVEPEDPLEARLHRGVTPDEILASINEAVGGERGRARRHRADPGREALHPCAERAEDDRREGDPPERVGRSLVPLAGPPVVVDLVLNPAFFV